MLMFCVPTFLLQLSPSVSAFIHSVPFQPATDNRSNFGSDKAFHTFKKQRYMKMSSFVKLLSYIMSSENYLYKSEWQIW